MHAHPLYVHAWMRARCSTLARNATELKRHPEMARTKQSAQDAKDTGGKRPRKSVKRVKAAQEDGAKGAKRKHVGTEELVDAKAAKERKKRRLHPGTRASMLARQLRKRNVVIPLSFIRARMRRAIDDETRRRDAKAASLGDDTTMAKDGNADVRISRAAALAVQRAVDDWAFDLAARTVHINRETSRTVKDQLRKRPITKGHLLIAARSV